MRFPSGNLLFPRSVLVIVVLAFVFQPLLVGDLFGYLVYGDWMVEHASLITVDTFSFTASGSRWINHEWLFQLGLGLIFDFSGWTGLMVLQFILVASILVLMAWIVDERGLVFEEWAMKFVVPVLAVVPGLTLRPQLFTYLAILLLVIRYDNRGVQRSDFFVMPALFVLWSNVHGGVIIGLAFLGYLLFRACIVNDDTTGLMRPLALFGFCGISTLVNPYGIELWWMIAGTVSDPVTPVFIEEWQPTWRSVYHFVVWCVLSLFWLGAELRTDVSDPRERWLRITCLLGVSLLSLWPRRNLTYYGLAVASFSPGFRFSSLLRWSLPDSVRTGLTMGGLIGGFLLLVVTFSSGFYTERGYPAELLNQIDTDKRSTRVFVYYPWAQWAFFEDPQIKVFLDGRWKTVYPDKIIHDYGKIMLGDTSILRNYGIDWVLLPGRYNLNRRLQDRNGWMLVDRKNDIVLWRNTEV